MTSLKVESLYKYLNNEGKNRVCTDVSDEACKKAPANYFRILLSNTLTKLGDALINPKTVLTWLMNLVGAPVYLIGFIVPIRESGSMLPQIAISTFIRRLEIRKWVWILGAFLQFFAVLAIGFISLNFKGILAGYLIVFSLVIFSLSRGLCSITSKDVLGKTIPKTRRGKLKGYTASFSGVLVLAVGLYMALKNQEELFFYSTIVICAAFLWIFAAFLYWRIEEFPGETNMEKASFRNTIEKLSLVKTDSTFRNFIISRSLLLCSSLSAPFYVLLAQNNIGNSGILLALFIIANGLSSIISAPIWGNFADKSSKKVMAVASFLASITGFILIGLIFQFPKLGNQLWLYPVAFFILGIAHSGVRLGRKTYIVDIAGGNKRTDYVAVSNTLIGFILLITGGISALASIWSVSFIIIVLAVLGLMGAVKSFTLPEAEQKQ